MVWAFNARTGQDKILLIVNVKHNATK